MAAMASTFEAHKVAGWFRLIAFAEAVTWVGLLIGMYFKYLGTPRTEVGVKIFGMAHGLVFIAFVVAALLVGMAFKWRATVVVAGFAGEHRPAGQRDLPHMGRADGPPRRPHRRRGRPTGRRNDVTNLSS